MYNLAYHLSIFFVYGSLWFKDLTRVVYEKVHKQKNYLISSCTYILMRSIKYVDCAPQCTYLFRYGFQRLNHLPGGPEVLSPNRLSFSEVLTLQRPGPWCAQHEFLDTLRVFSYYDSVSLACLDSTAHLDSSNVVHTNAA
jgi:hypothetical protein